MWQILHRMKGFWSRPVNIDTLLGFDLSDQVLNSPWDVAHDAEGGFVYIAMAGQHQIWRYNIADGRAEVFSGDGYERNQNGKRSHTRILFLSLIS